MSSLGKARNPFNQPADTAKTKKDVSILYGLSRSRGIPTSTAFPIFGTANPNRTNSNTYLNIRGGSMIGPIAFHPNAISSTLVSAKGHIGISQNGGGFSSNVIVNTTPSSDNISFIDGDAFDGQILYFHVINGVTDTFKTDGNIIPLGGVNVAVTGSAIAVFMFDSTLSPNGNSGGWVMVSNGMPQGAGAGTLWSAVTIDVTKNMAGFGLTNLVDPTNAQDVATKHYVDNSSAAGANTALSNLIATSINQSLIPNADITFDLGNPTGPVHWRNLYIGQMRFDSTRNIDLNPGTAGIAFNGKVADTLQFKINASNMMTITSSTIAMSTAITGSSTLAITGTTNLNGNVTLGTSSANTIALNGLVNTDVIPSVTAADSLGSTSKGWLQLFLGNAGGNPTQNGQVLLNGADVLVFSGGAIRNLSVTGFNPADISSNLLPHASNSWDIGDTGHIWRNLIVESIGLYDTSSNQYGTITPTGTDLTIKGYSAASPSVTLSDTFVKGIFQVQTHGPSDKTVQIQTSNSNSATVSCDFGFNFTTSALLNLFTVSPTINVSYKDLVAGTNGVTNLGNGGAGWRSLILGDSGLNPTADGQMTLNGGHVKLHTGGNVVDLGAVGGVNPQLSNLVAPTSINADLLPLSDQGEAIGLVSQSTLLRWSSVAARQFLGNTARIIDMLPATSAGINYYVGSSENHSFVIGNNISLAIGPTITVNAHITGNLSPGSSVNSFVGDTTAPWTGGNFENMTLQDPNGLGNKFMKSNISSNFCFHSLNNLSDTNIGFGWHINSLTSGSVDYLQIVHNTIKNPVDFVYSIQPFVISTQNFLAINGSDVTFAPATPPVGQVRIFATLTGGQPDLRASTSAGGSVSLLTGGSGGGVPPIISNMTDIYFDVQGGARNIRSTVGLPGLQFNVHSGEAFNFLVNAVQQFQIQNNLVTSLAPLFLLSGMSGFVNKVSTNYIAAFNDFVILATGTSNQAITLLPASNGNQVLFIKKTASGGTLSIQPHAGDTIDGSGGLAFSTLNGGVQIISDGVSNWAVISNVNL